MLTSVLDWHTLERNLGLQDSSLGAIRIDHSAFGTDRQRSEMISKWLAFDTKASWSKLATALEEMDNNALAETIREKYIPGYISKFTRDTTNQEIYLLLSRPSTVLIFCNIMSYGSTPYVGMAKASMRHIRHYRVLPWTVRLLTSPESIAEVPNGTRCRGGVKVLWCHSHLAWLVFEASIPKCACFHPDNFL